MRLHVFRRLFLPALLLAGLFAGCTTPRSYLEPKYHEVSYGEIEPLPAPIPVVLTVNGETNGKPVRRATEYWQASVVRVLAASHVFTVAAADAPHPAHLTITINNVGDIGEAFTKGFRTSLTLGALGNTVTDGYVMKAEFEAPDGRRFANEYRHAIYTSRGRAEPPPGVIPVPVAEAPVRVTDDLVLHLLKDLRLAGCY